MLIKCVTSQLNYCFNYNSLYFSQQFWFVEQIYFIIIWREKTHSSNRLRAPYEIVDHQVVVWTKFHRWTVCYTLLRLSNPVRFVHYWVKSESCFVLFTQYTRIIYFHRNRREDRKDISFRRAPCPDRVLHNDGLHDLAGNTGTNRQSEYSPWKFTDPISSVRCSKNTNSVTHGQCPLCKSRAGYERTTFAIQKGRLR